MTHEEMLEEAARREFEDRYGDALEEIARLLLALEDK